MKSKTERELAPILALIQGLKEANQKWAKVKAEWREEKMDYKRQVRLLTNQITHFQKGLGDDQWTVQMEKEYSGIKGRRPGHSRIKSDLPINFKRAEEMDRSSSKQFNEQMFELLEEASGSQESSDERSTLVSRKKESVKSFGKNGRSRRTPSIKGSAKSSKVNVISGKKSLSGKKTKTKRYKGDNESCMIKTHDRLISNPAQPTTEVLNQSVEKKNLCSINDLYLAETKNQNRASSNHRVQTLNTVSDSSELLRNSNIVQQPSSQIIDFKEPFTDLTLFIDSQVGKEKHLRLYESPSSKKYLERLRGQRKDKTKKVSPREFRKATKVHSQALKDLAEFSERFFTKPSTTTEVVESSNRAEEDAEGFLPDPSHNPKRLINMNQDFFDHTYINGQSPKSSHRDNFSLSKFTRSNENNEFKVVYSRTLHLDAINSLDFLNVKGGLALVTSSEDCVSKLWSLDYKVKALNPYVGVSLSKPQSSKQFRNANTIRSGGKAQFLFDSVSCHLRQTVRSSVHPLISSCLLSTDQSLSDVLCTGNTNGDIFTYRLSDEGLLEKSKTIKGLSEPVWSLAHSSGELVLGSTPNRIRLFSVVNGDYVEFSSLVSNRNFYGCAEFYSPNEFVVNSFYSKTTRNEFVFYDIQKRQESNNIHFSGGFSNVFKSIAKYDLLIAASDQRTISLFDVREKQVVSSFVAHVGPVVTFDTNLDNHLIVSGGLDHSVRLWDTRTFKCLKEVSLYRPKNEETVHQLRICPKVEFIYVACSNASLRIYHI